MERYKEEFIEFLLKTNALKFGEFTLKSGRKSPYFVNTGSFDDGTSVAALGHYYAAKIASFEGVNVVFGPAYKGISLAVATAVALSKDFGKNVKYCYNRKEEKAHGDKGVMVGYALKDGDSVVVVDDVFTTGETKVEAVQLLRSLAKVNIKAIVIAVDRQEKGVDGKNAIQEFVQAQGVPVHSIVTVREIVEYLHNRKVGGVVHIDDGRKLEMELYLKEYGV